MKDDKPTVPTVAGGTAFLPISSELLVQICAQSAVLALKESGFLQDLSDAQAVLTEIKLLKEGLLTREQMATMLQISVKTFKRQVAAGMWPEIRLMGNQEYRYPLPGVLAAMFRQGKYKLAAGEKHPLEEAA